MSINVKLRNLIITTTCICEWLKDRLMGRGGPSLSTWLHWFGPAGLKAEEEEWHHEATQQYIIRSNTPWGVDEFWNLHFKWPESWLEYPEVQAWEVIADEYRAEDPEEYEYQ